MCCPSFSASLCTRAPLASILPVPVPISCSAVSEPALDPVLRCSQLCHNTLTFVRQSESRQLPSHDCVTHETERRFKAHWPLLSLKAVDETQMLGCPTADAQNETGCPTMADLERLLKPMSTPAKASTYTCPLLSTCTSPVPLPPMLDTHPMTFALIFRFRNASA